ncbi:alpha-D-xyloside xylohydrolase [Mariniphaga anaerophila]|uniref:Alpha-D-xyloside xylohydrolase n=1 Tax=Mariniphaga anaerophila TaxID=1484053 RepID=A0A1M4Y4Z0_9BACT|nr:TIM-barrel domain-containing protein [Mariniphaga anaerophila]SHF00522.1 alpha-D-xyloside xylohydrolase [Mariniphaga anaerophila]
MKIVSCFFIILAGIFWGCSSPQNLKTDDKGIAFVNDSIQYRVEFLTPHSARILSLPKGDTLVTQRLVVSDSLPRFQNFTTKEGTKELTFSTEELTVLFNIEEKAFSFFETKTGKLLLKEKGNGESRTFTNTSVAGEECLNVVQRFVPDNEEALYGLGQYQNGVMNYRGDSVLFLQANMDIVNPFLVSTNRYGILWDNYSSSMFKDDETGYSFSSEVADASDYYFVYGKDMDEVIAGYRELTGEVPMFGKWVYGFWQSKERYKSFAELENVVKEYRKRKIPLDNIVQDWEYWGGKEYWNRLSFDQKNFDNPEAVINRLHNRYNVHFMLSVWPGFGPKTKVYAELDSVNALFNEPTWAGYKIFDAYNPYARDIFWQKLKTGLFNKGVDAWWMDATEPSFRDGFTQLKQEEKTKSAGKTYIGTFHRYLNVYSLELIRFLHEKLRKETDEKRVFILTRSAFASQQKYAAAVWSGDVSASWQNMKKQLAAGLNLSMSGIPYWTSDIGGFFVTERGAQFPEGLKSDEYKELYSRWFQFGAFSPLFRAHGTNVPREIWQFGSPGTVYYDNQLQYIKLRYRLLPYIYSLSYKVTAENYTMFRGLAMDFTQDTQTFNVNNAYMFGPAFLVRPVFEPLSVSAKTATYLPAHKGGCWYNFWTGEAVKCGQIHNMHTPLDVMPLYIKGGSVIPFAEEKQYTTEFPDTNLEVRIYSGADAAFDWYDDEGDSYRYQQGMFSQVRFQWYEDDQKFVIGERNGNYDGMPKNVHLTIRLYSPEQPEPVEKSIQYSGQEVTLFF